MPDALVSGPALIDSHCHLNDPRFAEDLQDVIARSVASGIERLIVVGYDLETSEAAVRMAAEYEPLYAAVGVHPHDAQHYDEVTRDRLVEIATAPKVVAIGEIGLGYHYDFSPREDQHRAFPDQVEIARRTRLPVIVHCREAYTDTLDVLEAAGIADIGGVMHCWGGNEAAAARTLELGMYLGIAGTVTFKKAEEIRMVARSMPADRLMVETDAPYLAPVPYRGKRNEPAYVREVAARIATERSVSLDVLAASTNANVRRLFPRLR
jgi:TatD DNase family protein